MIDHLVERGWTRQQSYAICSVAVDLKISQLVDVPNMLVSAFLLEDIFVGQAGRALIVGGNSGRPFTSGGRRR